MAVRMAESLVHPRVFATADGGLTPKMTVTFLVCFVAIALLWETLVRFELATKSSRARIGRLRRALDNKDAAASSSRIAPVAAEGTPS
jgi:heme exporter protein C